MRHGFIKVFLLLVAISLFMALTGYTAKHRVIAVFINQLFLNTGKGEVVMEVETEAAGSGRTELYTAALNLLRERKKPEAEGAVTAFRNEFRINNITEADGDVVVDFSSRRLMGTEAEERMLIAQIVGTLTRSFDEVRSVSFTVDGEAAETLMGHVDITDRFTQMPELES